MAEVNTSGDIPKGLGGFGNLNADLILENNLGNRGCDVESFKRVAEKILRIYELLVTSYKEEREKSGDKSFYKKEFTEELNKEISSTDKTLYKKSKEIGKIISNELDNTGKNMISSIQGDIKLTREKLKQARAKESLLKKEADNVNDGMDNSASDSKEQMALTEYKPLGFFGVLKRVMSERKDKQAVKQSIFSAMKTAFLEAYGRKAEANVSYDKIEMSYNEQCKIDETIKKCEQTEKNLSRQIRDITKQITQVGEEVFKKLRDRVDTAVKPVLKGDITIESITRAINEFKAQIERGVDENKNVRGNSQRGADGFSK